MNAIIGIVLGFLCATVSESVGHRVFGHPSPLQLKLYFRFPKFFAPFLKAYYHHYVIHHQLTFQQDVLTQFRSEDEKRQVDGMISKEFSPSFANLIWREQYNLTLKGVQGILPFAVPFLLGPIIIGYFWGSVAFFYKLSNG